MEIFIAAIILLGIGVFGMCFNIIFRKHGRFPQTEVSKNDDMRKLGIKCMNEQEQERLAKERKKKKIDISSICSGEYSDACIGCSLFNSAKKK
jgi:hypothetical protein